MQQHTFHAELKGIAENGTGFMHKTKHLPDNKLMCLQHVCVVNHDKNNARAQIGFITGGSIMWIDEIKCTSDGVLYAQEYNVWFHSSRGIVVKWVNANDNDRIEAYIYGYYKD